MPSEELFRKIEALDPRAIVVRTMYDYPEPNWSADELKKLYFTTPEDWKQHFESLGFQTVHAQRYKTRVPDMKGRSRMFPFTEYIGMKADA